MSTSRNVQALLARASAAAASSEMSGNLQFSSARAKSAKTNPTVPSRRVDPGITSSPRTDAFGTNPIEPTPNVRESSGMFNNVRESSAERTGKSDETNPPRSELTPRQAAAARLIVLGRTGREVARELKVEEHTITRWRRMPGFAAEIARQERMVLAMQLGERRPRA